MNTSTYTPDEEHSRFDVAKFIDSEIGQALIKKGYVTYFQSIDPNSIGNQIRDQIERLKTYKTREDLLEENSESLKVRILITEIVMNIRDRIKVLILRKQEDLFGPLVFITDAGRHYIKYGDNIEWKDILTYVPERPSDDLIVSINDTGGVFLPTQVSVSHNGSRHS